MAIKPKFVRGTIQDLLRQLPEGSVTAGDGVRIKQIRSLITALRVPVECEPAQLLDTEVCHALAMELHAALGQIIVDRIPRNPVGRPRSTAPVARQDEQREAKAQLDEKRKELQTLKRAAMEMREALETFEKRAVFAAGCEVVGMPPDNEARSRNLIPALTPVYNALDALRAGATSHERLLAKAEAMQANCDALERATQFWCNAQNVRAEGKAGGVHKGKALAEWLEACRTLSRDIAEEIRGLK